MRGVLVPCALLAALVFGGSPTPAAATGCLLCAAPPGATRDGSTAPVRPLRIAIETNLEFSRVAAGNGAGQVSIAPDGTRRVAGALTDLGGMALAGSVVVTGEPGRAIRVTLPTRIMLDTANGGTAIVEDLRSDLSPDPRLDVNGRLRFSFGGRLVVTPGSSGTFRGSIPISADYE